ncbi:MAG: Kelch repeat-containing protein, partial [Planctomycetota bacterium]
MTPLSRVRRNASTAALAVAVALAVAAAAGCRAKTRPEAEEPPAASRPGRGEGEHTTPVGRDAPPRVRPGAEPHDAAPARVDQRAEPEDTAPPVRPSPRSEFAAAYAGGTRLVMFGGDGYTEGRKLGDTWEYDSRTHRWTQYEQRGEKPSPRSWPAMAYAGGTKVVMFGGHVGRGKGFVGDTWEYDVETHAWERVRPEGDGPSARGGHALAYLGGAKVLMFGGFNFGAPEKRYTDTWEYDAAARAWRKISTRGKTPPVRGDYDMAWAGENRAVLFGGSYPAGKGLRHRADTWQYDATTQTWQEVAAPGPKGRCDHAMAGLGDGKILLMGGWQDRKDAIFRDVWEFDAARGAWREIERDGISPSRRHIHVMARAGKSKVVVFGGSSRTDETWEYSRAKRKWTAALGRRSMELAWTSKEATGTYCAAWADYD